MAELQVPVVIRLGKKSAQMRGLLDTGSEMTMISSAYAKKLGQHRGAKGHMVGAGGQVTIWGIKVSDVQIPGTRCSSGPMWVSVFDERVYPMGGMTGLSAIVGLDFMQKAKMNIAAAAKTGMISCDKRLAELLAPQEST